jgi:tripartite-type tricarboxylate transporter receptor subunit TctC
MESLMTTRRIAIAASGVLLAALGLFGAVADDASSAYPKRPVQITIPFAAGGSSDSVMRVLASGVSKQWGQPVIIDNRPGATGAIAGEYVTRQPADGYTLLNAAPSSHTALRALRRDLPYDPMTDLVPATLVAIAPMILVVNPKKVPVRTVAELVEYLRANPNKLSYASTGIGSVAHLSVELFKLLTKTQMVHVPYRGNAPALNDLLAGNVDLTIDVSSSIAPHLASGAIRAVGVTTAQRTTFFPDIPAVSETVPGFEAFSWNGIVVRSGTPQGIIEKIRTDFSKSVRDPAATKLLASMLMEPVGSSPETFQELIESDRRRWERVANAIDLESTSK